MSQDDLVQVGQTWVLESIRPLDWLFGPDDLGSTFTIESIDQGVMGVRWDFMPQWRQVSKRYNICYFTDPTHRCFRLQSKPNDWDDCLELV